MFPKQLLKDYLVFTRNDRIGAIVIVLVVGGSLFLPRFLAPTPPSFSYSRDTALVLALDTLQQRQAQKKFSRQEEKNTAFPFERSAAGSYTNGELFPFDPNTITAGDWQRLGLNGKTAKTILNYRNKGGRFYKPEDLQKIWGMPAGFYERVKDYIRIPEQRKVYAPQGERPQSSAKERGLPVFNINTADTAALIALPGIGSKLSARIIAFREKLGGFYSVEQVGETYGLPDSTFQKIRNRLQTDGSNLRKININTASKDELKAHPYIRWNLASAIVEYRNQHGAFKSKEELKNIVLIDEETYRKLSHYLTLAAE